MVKSENSKIRVLIYNSSDSAIIATLRDLYYLFYIYRDSPIFPTIRFFNPIIATIYTILRFFRLYDSSDCSDCPPIIPVLQ